MGEGEIRTEKDLPKRWNYETHFREYLLLLGRAGALGLESFSNFPHTIELNHVWHETLDEMRRATKDGKERWAFVGFRTDMRTLVLPSVFGVGTLGNPRKGIANHVSPEVIRTEIDNAKEKTGIIGLVGDIHTHPRTDAGFGNVCGFSVADLYCVLTPDRFLPMMGVLEPDKNFFVFKTRESTDIPGSSKIFTQDAFERYWYREFGKSIRTVELNKKIAARHKLVLYKGGPNSDLERIYP